MRFAVRWESATWHEGRFAAKKAKARAYFGAGLQAAVPSAISAAGSER